MIAGIPRNAVSPRTTRECIGAAARRAWDRQSTSKATVRGSSCRRATMTLSVPQTMRNCCQTDLLRSEPDSDARRFDTFVTDWLLQRVMSGQVNGEVATSSEGCCADLP